MISPVTIYPQSSYNIIDHIPYAVYYIPMTTLLYNQRPVSLSPFHLFRPPPPHLPAF